MTIALDLASLRRRYLEGALRPVDLIESLGDRLLTSDATAVWIHRLSLDRLRADAEALERHGQAVGIASLPLYGVPFAVKDNIDVAGLPTTAACPGFAYDAERSATVVEKLLAAGALLVGKTNLDQFATGLAGVRSPYGMPRNPFDPAFVPGGSSSGSAVAVAMGLVSFALGTDTAGSGRVPAAFNNVVGLKPTRGLLSAAGVVPACRSLDCVSIFALTVADAMAVLAETAGLDAADPLSRAAPAGFRARVPEAPPRFVFGVPRPDQRRFFGNADAERLYGEAIARLGSLGGEAREIDYAPLVEAAGFLYGGPWLAERASSLGSFLAERPQEIHPVVREILSSASRYTAADTFAAQHRLAAIRRALCPLWQEIACLVLPSAGTLYRVEELLRDPIELNANLGYYTNFVNLLDLAAIAVPGGFQANGLPAGITLVAPAWHDAFIAGIAARFHQATGLPLGATGAAQPSPPGVAPLDFPFVPLAVVGAHLSGEPLNPQLTALGARLRRAGRTAPCYRLYALPDGKRPGLLRVADGGAAIELEVWDVPAAALGVFLAGIAPPLGIGTIELEDGRQAKGFLCESHAVASAIDITAHGGWRAYRRSQR